MISKFTVDRSSVKLASFLKEALGDSFSAKFIKKCIEKGACRVNNRVLSYASAQLKKGDKVEIAIQQPEQISIEVVYQDEFLAIIDKPSGVLCHESNLKNYLKFPFYLVHRLDKETTGLLILAKNTQVKAQLERMFKEKTITKKYLALCDGLIKNESGVIEAPLKSFQSAQHAVVVKVDYTQGSPAKTLWRCLATGTHSSLLEFSLITGKTHQIRVHAAFIGHALLADPVYLQKPVCSYLPEGLCLHAYYLSFEHPVTHTIVQVVKAPQGSFMKALKHLIPDAKLPCY